MSISSLRHLSGGKITRRFWLAQLGALSLGTAACSRGTNQGGGEGTGSGSDLQLSFACVDNYDRTRPLLDGTVKPEGIVLQSQAEGPAALFRQVAQQADFDVSEMSTSTFMILTSRGDDRYVGIPVYPSRNFRHGYVFINRNSGISRPEDLAGKRVGMVEYQTTAALWQRIFLQDDYGIRAQQIEWSEGGLNTPDEPERFHVDMPSDIHLSRIGPGETLSQMLEEGKLDALIGPAEPECFRRASHIERLFPDYRSVEKDYYKRSGFFPIMHLVVIRREIYQEHPWVAQSLFDAFQSALASQFERIRNTSVLACALPWLMSDLEEIDEVFGGEHWPYGIAKNKALLERMTQASFEQGLSSRKLEVEELFAEETWGT
jgi:4,5-dihydroxyphthalate decarboxylase